MELKGSLEQMTNCMNGEGLITASGSFFITHCHRDNLAEQLDCWAEKEWFSSQPTNLHRFLLLFFLSFFFFWELPSFTCKWISPPRCTPRKRASHNYCWSQTFTCGRQEASFKMKDNSRSKRKKVFSLKRTYWSCFVSWRKLIFIP